MLTQLTAPIVRVLTANGIPAGAGFLVADRQVLTCAHVVAQALDLPQDTLEQPTGTIHLDFPFVAGGHQLTAAVVGWYPIQAGTGPVLGGCEDVAILELIGNRPEGSQPARLVAAEDLWDHHFRAFGFPPGHEQGVWANGLLRDIQAGGWVQIEDEKATGYFVVPGFSGTLVWDSEVQGVVGMVVSADKRTNVRAAFAIPTVTLINAWPALRDQAIPPNPYQGLYAFEEKDAAFFFGREAAQERLVEAVRKKPVVAVVGPSGSGKSSVVFAGLVPQLRQEGGWVVASFRPGDQPFAALAAVLIPLLEPQMTTTDSMVEARKLADALEQGTLLLSEVMHRILSKDHAARRLLLIANQFEELYTLCRDTRQRHQFLDVLLEWSNAPSRQGMPEAALVLTLRADFFGHALSHRPLADVLQDAALTLGPMTRQELQAAIEQPARKQGVRIEGGLTERILDAVIEAPGNLPLLEFALAQLWAHQKRGMLTHAAYNAVGGVEKALATYANEVYEGLNSTEKRGTRRVFIQLVRPGEGTEDTRRRACRSEVGEDDWDLITHLADARLVVTGHDDPAGEDTVEVAHEALIREWALLRQWMEGDRAFRTWQEQLRVVVRQWAAHENNKDLLLRGVPLAEAEGWLRNRPADLSFGEESFILAGLELQAAEAQEREAARQRELDQANATVAAQTARTRTARWFALGASILMLVAIGAAILAGLSYQQAVASSRQAQQQTHLARAQALAANALDQLDRDPEVSMLLALEAVSTTVQVGEPAVPQAEDALQQAMLRSELLHTLAGHAAPVSDAAFSSDGQTLVTVGHDDTVRIWDTMTGKGKATLFDHTDEVNSIAFSPDGRSFVTASKDGTARLWDAATGRPRAVLVGHSDPVNRALFSPDGRWVVTAGWDGTARLWDAATGQPHATLTGHTAGVNSATFSPDGRFIVTASDDGTARVWDVTTGETRLVLTDHTAAVTNALFSPDGHRILTASNDGTARLWDAGRGRALAILADHPDGVTSLTFSPDGNTIITAGWNSTVRLWTTATGQVQITLANIRGPIHNVTYSPDGRSFLTASDDGTVQLWDSISGEMRAILVGHLGPVRVARFSPDGQVIATVSDDHTTRLWYAATDQRRTILRGHTGAVYHAAFSPDQRFIITASQDHTARIWDSATGQLHATFGTGDEQIYSAAFSPNGRFIVTVGAAGTAYLWDATTRQVLKTLSGHTGSVYSAAFSADSRLIATAGDDQAARLWDVTTGQLRMVLTGHEDAVTRAIFSPDGQWVATSSDDRTVRLWDVATGQTRAILRGHTGPVASVAFSPDGRWVATGSWDGTARLWDATTGQAHMLLYGHTNTVTSVAYSPDGHWVVTASADNTARIWDAVTGQLHITLRGHLEGVNSALFSPNGHWIVTGSWDGTARQYLIDPTELLALAETRVTRSLTLEERITYLGETLPTTGPGLPATASPIAMPTSQP